MVGAAQCHVWQPAVMRSGLRVLAVGRWTYDIYLNSAMSAQLFTCSALFNFQGSSPVMAPWLTPHCCLGWGHPLFIPVLPCSSWDWSPKPIATMYQILCACQGPVCRLLKGRHSVLLIFEHSSTDYSGCVWKKIVRFREQPETEALAHLVTGKSQ
jgi:hypothetical protein